MCFEMSLYWKKSVCSENSLPLSLFLLSSSLSRHLSPPYTFSVTSLSGLKRDTRVCSWCVRARGALKKVAGPFDGSCSTFEGWIFFRLCRHDKRPLSHKRPTWSELCALCLSLSLTLLHLTFSPVSLFLSLCFCVLLLVERQRE